MAEPDAKTFYELHQRGFLFASIVFDVLLAALPLISQQRIDSVLGGSGSPQDVIVCLLLLAFFVCFGCFKWYVKSRQKSLVSDRDARIEALNDKLSEERVESDGLKRSLKASERMSGCLSELADKNATMANDAVHAIEDGGSVELPKRSFEQDCKSVCKQLRICLDEYYKTDVSFEVSYVRRDEAKDVMTVVMVGASATDESEVFSCLGVSRSIGRRNSHFDVRLFGQYGLICRVIRTRYPSTAFPQLSERSDGWPRLCRRSRQLGVRGVAGVRMGPGVKAVPARRGQSRLIRTGSRRPWRSWVFDAPTPAAAAPSRRARGSRPPA